MEQAFHITKISIFPQFRLPSLKMAVFADGGMVLPLPSLKMPVFADGGLVLPLPSLKMPVFADGV